MGRIRRRTDGTCPVSLRGPRVRGARWGLFGCLFRCACALGFGELADTHRDAKARCMVGTFAADEAIFGGAALARERPFLERRLRMLGRRELPFDHVAPVASDEGARGLFAPVGPQRADQRLDHVGGDIVALSPTVADRLPPEPEIGKA